ncbi:MAG: ATP-dependent RecD-like DNA helicase [Eubacteriales bacterium]
MEEIKGQVEAIIFRNAENKYTIFEVVGEEEEMVCVGVVDSLQVGEMICVRGEYVDHATYGRQLKVIEYEVKMPQDIDSLERYLASGAVSGIGKELAKRIVRKFGEDTLHIMENQPERLAEVKGISERKAVQIAEQLNEKQGMRATVIALQKYGITNNLAIRLYEKYGAKAYEIIGENPYRIVADIPRVGFKIADEIARTIGIHIGSDERIKSGMLHILTQANVEGHMYLSKVELLQKAEGLLGIEQDTMEPHIMNMILERSIIAKNMEEDVWIYGTRYYNMEMSCAKKILDLAGSLMNEEDFTREDTINNRISELEEKTNLIMEEEQRRAVRESARHGVVIVTGGPGTGKTTIINNMIEFFLGEKLEIVLAAPTGRAAKRMTEMTGYEAKTIHRLLELNPSVKEQSGIAFFGKNEDNPIEVDVIIIDEMSMVDIYLFQALLKAVMVGTRLIMVGDINQLPSVGPGQVLRDLIASEAIPVISLKKIFRQSAESDIVMNAHRINQGEAVDLHKKSKDFVFLERDNVQVIYKHMLELIITRIPPYIDGTSYDIQVMTPMRKGNLGVEELNLILQKYLNPTEEGKREYRHGDRIFREGDKVMQVKNNYQLEWEMVGKYNVTIEKGVGVFNGDIGIILELNPTAQTIKVLYDDQRIAIYPYSGLDELELAYAITIHKSQGSEYKAVLIPLLRGPSMLMNRNLLYTGITRAKQCVTILGSSETIAEMIQNESENKRNTSLHIRIKELERSC